MEKPRPRTIDQKVRILQGLAEGKSRAEIARDLGVATQTIKNTVVIFYEQMGVKDDVQAVIKALQDKTLDLNHIPIHPRKPRS